MPLQIAIAYAVFGMGWILFSDRMLASLGLDTDTLTRLQTWKGWLFVAVSAVLIHAISAAAMKALRGKVSALRLSEARYRELFEGNPQPMWAFDLDSLAIIDMNAAALRVLGLTRRTMPASIRLLLDASELERFDSLIEHYRGEGGEAFGRWRLRRGDGSTIVVDIGSHPLALDGSRVRLVSASDVTEQVAAEAALSAATAQLERTDAEIAQLSQAAAHQLQAPLRTVVSYLQLLERRYPHLDGEAREFLHFAVDGALKMKAVVDDILQFTGMERDPPEPVDMNEVVNGVLATLRPVLMAIGAEVSQGPLPLVQGRRRHLALLVHHLIDNAVKFRDPGRALRVDVSAHEVDGGWQFRVADNGAGIAREHHTDVFEVFRRLDHDAAAPGTGIGLALCRKIVEQHGGTIHVESEPGQGACFIFRVPAQPTG